MRRFHFIFLVLSFFIFCKGAPIAAQTQQEKPTITATAFPKQIGFVNDFENIFTEEQKTQLTKLLTYYYENSSREITVVTLNAIPNTTEFGNYAIALSDHWNRSKNNNENALTIVMSKSLREIRISTTDKTRLSLTDDFCKTVIYEFMIPEFKKDNYFDGLLFGYNELIVKWR